MSIAIEYWNLVVRVDAIEKHYVGGWVKFCKDKEIPLPAPSYLTDGQLLRVGGMSRTALLTAEGDMKDTGLKGWTGSPGKGCWKDYCILTDLASVEGQCKWLVAGHEPSTVQLASTKAPTLDKHLADALWSAILARLDAWKPSWRDEIEGLGQISQLKKRTDKEAFSDNDIFEGMLYAVLSNATAWKKVKEILGRLPSKFDNFSLAAYADKDNDHVNNLVSWFKDEKKGSMTLRKGLRRLTEAAQRLQDWSVEHGSADNYFDAVLREANQDRIRAVALLGTAGTDFKLSGMGIPLAAEAMKNIGYDVAKPDRHICRALGCFGLVSYRNWADQSPKQAPITSIEEQIETMRVIEVWGKLIDRPAAYVDQVIWLLCSTTGPHLENFKLRSLNK